MPKRKPFRRKKYIPKHDKGETRRVESKNAILELLKKGQSFIEIQIAHNANIDPKTREIQRMANEQGIPFRRVVRNVMNRQATTDSYESVIGIMPRRDSKSLKTILEETKDEKNRSILLLDGISYSQNLGAILRTAYGAGVVAVVIPPSKGAEVNSEVTRISMGASEIVPIVFMSMYSAVDLLKQKGFKIFGMDMEGDRHYYNENIWGDSAFIFGSEAEGSSENLLENTDATLSIPIKGDLESLNVSVSVGIILYEKMRQEK